MTTTNTNTNERTHTIRQTAKETLTASWQTLIASGDMTAEDLATSLTAQISGWEDLSLDELTEDLADLMGWDITDLTDDQLTEWRDLVNETAKEWLDSQPIGQMAQRITEAGFDEGYFADVAFAISEGCDFDEMCQQATDKIAEALGLPTMADTEDPYDNEDYCLVNDIVNEQVSTQLADSGEEDEEEYDTIEEALVAEWEHYTDTHPTSDQLADIQTTYERLVADGSTIGEALMEAVYIVADAQ